MSKLTPIKGPDGRLYLNLSEIATLIEESESMIVRAVPDAERRYWAGVLRAFEAGAKAQVGLS